MHKTDTLGKRTFGKRGDEYGASLGGLYMTTI